ncbi:GNAT family N-acetyltransferase [Spirochaeta dissipatitropha]
MWPHKQIDELRLPEDESGVHYGLFEESMLVCIVSLFVYSDTAQFRKFATIAEFQKRGYGSRLLQHIISECQETGVKKLWCNARPEKSSFYKRFGFTETNQIFEKDGKSYMIMELKTAAP